MKKFDLTTLLIFAVSCELLGALSGLTAGGGFGEVYSSLERPPLTPPPSVFPVIWGILYALMGTAAYLVWQTGHSLRKTALTAFAVQLAVNLLYTPVFFGLRSLTGGLVISALLFPAVAVTVYLFLKVRRPAGITMLPYLIWTAFALYLSAGLVVLNR